jgi:MYXO-CTERM domain-containing protein
MGSAAAGGTVEFRWYGYGAGSSNGVLGLTNHASLTADGNPVAVLLEGEVTVVPEPAAAAWLVALVALGWAFRRRCHGRAQ